MGVRIFAGVCVCVCLCWWGGTARVRAHVIVCVCSDVCHCVCVYAQAYACLYLLLCAVPPLAIPDMSHISSGHVVQPPMTFVTDSWSSSPP